MQIASYFIYYWSNDPAITKSVRCTYIAVSRFNAYNIEIKQMLRCIPCVFGYYGCMLTACNVGCTSRNSIAKRDTKRRNMNYNNANNNAFYVCVCASKITSVIFHTIKRLHLHRQTFQAYGTYFFMTNGNMYYILFPPQSDRTNGSLALVYFGEMIRWIEETAQF